MKTKSQFTIAQIIEAGHDAEQAPTVLALCQHLDCQPDDLELQEYDHYGMSVYDAKGGAEYAIGTDAEAQEAAERNIADSVWAFKASFILSECGLPSELEEAIMAFQSDKCEDANEALVALVEKCCGKPLRTGLEAFAESAISADGRGHFMSSYDGEENEETVNGETFYIYRTN